MRARSTLDWSQSKIFLVKIFPSESVRGLKLHW